jgi:hypothetical protein
MPLLQGEPLSLRALRISSILVFARRPLCEMSQGARIRVSYLNSCPSYVEHYPMSNTSLRERLDIPNPNARPSAPSP